MANPSSSPKAEPRIVAVTLARSVSFAGGRTDYFPAGKNKVVRDERGDLHIEDARGHVLFVPKAMAIVEYEPAPAAVKAAS
jgi:hypothetical protein